VNRMHRGERKAQWQQAMSCHTACWRIGRRQRTMIAYGLEATGSASMIAKLMDDPSALPTTRMANLFTVISTFSSMVIGTEI